MEKEIPLSEFTKEKKDEIVIYADEREEDGVIEELKNIGAFVKVMKLEVGDFILSERVAVERKTRKDFESSIIDGRLFKQAEELVQNFERGIFIIEGENFEERVNRNALLGALASLLIDFRLPVLFTRNSKKTAEFLFSIAKREQLEKKSEVRVKGEKRAKTIGEWQQMVIESLPNIGPKMAKALLSHFKTIRGVINANEKELKSINRLGEKRAKEIYKLLTAKYKPN